MNGNRRQLRLTIDDREARQLLKRKGNITHIWQRKTAPKIHKEMEARAISIFDKLRRGGTYRGVTWADFADQYRRKTDGQVVPAWGGVPKLRGKGLVKGRLRASAKKKGKSSGGARVTQSSALMQDTMTLRARALASKRITPSKLIMGTNVKYSRYLHPKRPWAFFHLPDDLEMMQGILLKDIEEA